MRVAGIAPGNKHGAIVDGNGNHIFRAAEWVAPERCRVKSAVDELGVLGLIELSVSSVSQVLQRTHVTRDFGSPDSAKYEPLSDCEPREERRENVRKVGTTAIVKDARVKVGLGPAIIEDLGAAS